jgi:tetratricopeptide (TPR) repeat protein
LIIASTFISLKQYEEAIICSDKVLKLEPNNPDALSSKGGALSFLQKFDEALDYCDRAL